MFTIVVNTCASYAPVTLPVLFESLDRAGVPRAATLVVVGQCPGGRLPEGLPGGTTYAAVEYTAECLTALVAAPDLVDTPWIFLLQDTMAVGPEFPARVQRAYELLSERSDPSAAGTSSSHAPSSSSSPLKCVRLLDRFSMSVGFYDVAWLRTLGLRERFARPGDCDVREIKRWSEDAVFDLAPPGGEAHLAEHDDPAQRRVQGEMRYVPGGRARTVEHYPVLDLTKCKSWDGDASKHGTYVDDEGVVRVDIPVGV